MYGIVNLTTFILSSIVFIMMPGSDTMFVIGRSITQGRKAGIYAVFGLATGVLIHTSLVAFGLALIVSKSILAFNLIKYTGALYLTYLGIRILISKPEQQHKQLKFQPRLHKVYLSGIMANLLNPKVILFFLVFLPQFVSITAAKSPLPFLILGLIFIIPSLIWCNFLAISADLVARKLNKNNRITTWLNRITGGVFILLGLKLTLLKK